MECPTFHGVEVVGCYNTERRVGCAWVRLANYQTVVMVVLVDNKRIEVLSDGGTTIGYIEDQEIKDWLRKGVVFNSWVTQVIGCRAILTLEPLKSEKKEELQYWEALT